MHEVASLISSLIHWAIFLAIVLAVIVWITYNRLQKLSQNVKEWNSNIQIALSKKIAEINQLMTMVKGYQEFEQFTQLKISSDSSAAELASAYQQSDATFSAIQVTAQKFPELKASQQYQRIIDSIQGCERDIQQKREIYNGMVKQYNSAYLSIPAVFLAPLLGFSKAPFLQFDTSGMQQENTLKEFKTDDGERLRELFGKATNAVAHTGKSIINKASEVGQSLAEGNTAAKPEGAAQETLYFYLVEGSAPAGPVPLRAIREQVLAGKLPLTVQVAAVGTSTWIPIQQAQ